MSVRFENLTRGGWYAVTSVAEDPPRELFGTRPRVSFDGQPFCVIDVSYPFVLCEGVSGVVTTFDVREVGLDSVLPRYVWSYRDNVKGQNGTRRKAMRRRKEKPDPGTCPPVRRSDRPEDDP